MLGAHRVELWYDAKFSNISGYLCTSYLYLYLQGCYPTSSSVIQSKGYTISYLCKNLLFTLISSTLFHPFSTPKSPKSSII
ncbi:hypothetical protein VN97_g3788 [Penicillium thymicola]|uniref:Uncharacterized protein n=1 Tax=Penicillium thymicola TaxID=293382 RepID=A0AAI9TLW4_PENTH|nr:hypothetical protein VN97_g3788 [Penicillium thymicola]